MHNFIFGVFEKGKIVFLFNKINCSNETAAVIVGILDLSKDYLNENQYFAADYAENHNL